MTRCHGRCAVISWYVGGVHAHAYALALKQLTGVDMTKNAAGAEYSNR
jgi:hypothetical protein